MAGFHGLGLSDSEGTWCHRHLICLIWYTAKGWTVLWHLYQPFLHHFDVTLLFGSKIFPSTSSSSRHALHLMQSPFTFLPNSPTFPLGQSPTSSTLWFRILFITKSSCSNHYNFDSFHNPTNLIIPRFIILKFTMV